MSTSRFAPVLILAVSVAGILVTASPASAQDIYNCGSFRSQAEAQAVYNRDTSDPNQLDGNPKNGLACDSHDYGATSAGATGAGGSAVAGSNSGRYPVGGVATGGGGMATDRLDVPRGPLVGLGVAAMACVGLVLARRGRGSRRGAPGTAWAGTP
jgi:hypothetical protein